MNKHRKLTLVIESGMRYILLFGFGLYYPGLLFYNFAVGFIGVFISKSKMFEGIPGIKELVVIEGISALVLGSLSILCAILLYRKHQRRMAYLFCFLLLTLAFYLMEPIWFRIAGYPVEYLNGHYYEKPLDLLRPIVVAIAVACYFLLSNYLEKQAE